MNPAEATELRALLQEYERRWRESEARFHNTIQKNADAIVIVNREGCVLFINAAAETLLGRSAQALQGSVFGFPLATGKAIEVDIVRPDGTVAIAEMRVTEIEWEGEQAYLASLRDITRRKWAEDALRESEDRFRTIMESMDDIIFTLDRRLRHTGIFGRWPARYGLSEEDFLGKTQRETTLDTELADIHEAAGARALTGEHIVYSWSVLGPDGERYHFQTALSPIFDAAGRVVQIVGVGRDITPIKRAEEALAARTQALQTLYQATLDLNAELDTASLLNRTMSSAVDLLGADQGGALYLYEPETDALRVVEARGLAEPFLGTTDMPKQGIVSQVFHSGKPFVIDDYTTWEGRVEASVDLLASTALLYVPLLRRGQVTGVLGLFADRQQHTFDEKDVRLAEMLAAEAAVAIENARLYQRLETHNEHLEKVVESRTAELRRATERTETLLNNSPDAILLLRPDGAIEAFNDAFNEMFGYPAGEVHGRSPTTLVAPSHANASAFSRSLRTTLEKGQPGRLEVLVQRQDGTTFPADAMFAPVQEGDAVRGAVCSMRDITTLKSVEHMKDAFISNISHELRTPIASIKLYHDLLERNPAKRSRYMERLRRETERLHGIVENVLYLTRIDQGQIVPDPRPVDLNALAAAYVTDREALAQSHGLTLTFERHPNLPEVQADPKLLEYALSNLLTNAINYTPAGGGVVVYTCTRQRNSVIWVGVGVQDTGTGISQDEVPHVFNRFFRGQAAEETNLPGTGLGLAIVKEIIDRHQGKVEVNGGGEPGQGAAFTIWLPARI